MRSLLILALSAATAHAATPLCVETRAESEAEGFRKLVEDQLAHHPTHRLVTDGCRAHLTAELFVAAGTRYLTLRIDQEVPVRFAVKTARDLEEKVVDGMRQVLQNDPVYLAEDLTRLNSVWRAGARMVRQGTNRYRLELQQYLGHARNAVFASGAAFSVARGIDHWQVFVRLSAAGSVQGVGDDVTWRALAGADAGLLWEQSARGNHTFYLGPAVGLHYMRFEARGADNPVNTVLFSVALRMGVRLLRHYGFDIDLYGQAHLPLHKTKDPDSTLLDDWTPYGTVGLGVGF
jgi:hypothetical protein